MNIKSKAKRNLSVCAWSNFNEWKACYDFLFNNSYTSGETQKIIKIEESLDNFICNLNLQFLKDAMNLLNIWKIRNDSSNIVLITSLLLEEIIKILQGEKIISVADDSSNILAQKIIRVTNLLIDDLKKKNKKLNSNMFLIAKIIDLPEFVVEIRHSCTHKVLPSHGTLLFVIKYLFFWIKQNIWDKQYEIFLRERDITYRVIFILENISNLTKKVFEQKISELDNILSDKDTQIEVDNMFRIVEVFMRSFTNSISFEAKNNNVKITKNNKNSFITSSIYCEKLDEFVKLYKLLQLNEGNILIPILFFKFISQQVYYFSSAFLTSDNDIINQSKNKLMILSFLANFTTKFSLEKGKSNINYQELISNIYFNLYFSKDFSDSIKEVFQYFVKLIGQDICNSFSGINVSFKKKHHDLEEVLRINDLAQYECGSLLFIQMDDLINRKDISEGNSQMLDLNKNNETIGEINEEMNITYDDFVNDYYEREIVNSLILN